MASDKTTLVLHQKLGLAGGLVMERMVWSVPRTHKYPLGVRYRLVLVDPKNHQVILLYDNHWPKGPHIHWDDEERPYTFVSTTLLLQDFAQEAYVEEMRYNENKKNRD